MNTYGVDPNKREEDLTEEDYDLIFSGTSKIINENTLGACRA